jgi:hypothetical protein
MNIPDFTVEHLKKLPLRAIVGGAARCARRVEHLAQLPEGHPEGEGRRAAVEAAIRLAEDFARGSEVPSAEDAVRAIDASRAVASGDPRCDHAVASAAEAAHATVSAIHALDTGGDDRGWDPLHMKGSAEDRKYLDHLEHVTADLVALAAFTAAAEAFDAVGLHNEVFVARALRDYDKLLELKLGRYPEGGGPIDPSPDGPLGPL